MKLSKKSQITPFIIIGLVLLSGIGIALFVKSGDTINKRIDVPMDISPVYSFVQDCAEKTLAEGIDYVSQKGGYYYTPEKSIDMEIAYYIYKNQNYMPLKEVVEEELASYVTNELQFCLNEFYELEEFSIESGDISSIVKINDDKVLLKMKYPISITKNNKTYALEEFEASYNSRLGIIYNIAKQIVEEDIKNTETICIGCLYDLSVKNEVIIKTLDYKEDVIYTITDEKLKINNKALVFNFAAKYK